VVTAKGYGHFRFRQAFSAGTSPTLSSALARNLASSANGASAAGDGDRLGQLIDDTERRTGSAPPRCPTSPEARS